MGLFEGENLLIIDRFKKMKAAKNVEHLTFHRQPKIDAVIKYHTFCEKFILST